MDEHRAAWQIAEFILGGLDEDELGRPESPGLSPSVEPADTKA